MAIYHFVNSQVQKNIFAFCVINIEPIEVQTHSAPRNDRLNLCFVKDTYVDGEKLARNGRKTADSLLKDAVLTVQVRFRLSITSSLVYLLTLDIDFTLFLNTVIIFKYLRH